MADSFIKGLPASGGAEGDQGSKFRSLSASGGFRGSLLRLSGCAGTAGLKVMQLSEVRPYLRIKFNDGRK
jgi:hypothetical protein